MLLETQCIAYTGYVVWKHRALHVQAMLPGDTVYCIYRLCCLETQSIACTGYVAWRHCVLHVQAMLSGDKLCCLCRGYVSWRKTILPEFLCIGLPQFPPGTCCETISNLTTVTYLHVPSISLFSDNRTVWPQCNTLHIIGSVFKYTINKSILRKTCILCIGVTSL